MLSGKLWLFKFCEQSACLELDVLVLLVCVVKNILRTSHRQQNNDARFLSMRRLSQQTMNVGKITYTCAPVCVDDTHTLPAETGVLHTAPLCRTTLQLS